MQREKFTTWFSKALRSLVGSQGILFLINLFAVFFSWTFFVMVYFALDKMEPISGLDFIYQNRDATVIGTFILFVLITIVSTWTYWDAYVRLSKPDRHKKPQFQSMQKPQEKLKIPSALKRKGKKPIFVSTHQTPPEKQTQPEEQEQEQPQEQEQVVSPVQKKRGGGRPKGSKNKPKETQQQV